jgi:hypothetical protein
VLSVNTKCVGEVGSCCGEPEFEFQNLRTAPHIWENRKCLKLIPREHQSRSISRPTFLSASNCLVDQIRECAKFIPPLKFIRQNFCPAVDPSVSRLSVSKHLRLDAFSFQKLLNNPAIPPPSASAITSISRLISPTFTLPFSATLRA